MAEEDDEHGLAFGFGDPVRLIALSDGVFAIIMTLLVLDLQIEHGLSEGELAATLRGNIPTFIAYVFGFLLAGVYWIGHRDLFSRVKVVTYPVLWLNIIFLMVAALIPFGANLLGNYPESEQALRIYASLLALLAFARLWLYWFVTARTELLVAPVPPGLRRRVIWVNIFAVSAFVFCVLLGHYLPPFVMIFIYGITPVIFVTGITWLSHGWLPKRFRHLPDTTK